MLSLELDQSETFFWSTDQTTRQSMKALGLTVLDSAREPGGILSFGGPKQGFDSALPSSVSNELLVHWSSSFAPCLLSSGRRLCTASPDARWPSSMYTPCVRRPPRHCVFARRVPPASFAFHAPLECPDHFQTHCT